MKTLTAELVETGEKRDARGRRVMRAEVREALLAAYASSGMTQRAFAEREGVKYCTLTKWLLLQRRKAATATPPAFAEVRLNGGRAPGTVEIVLPDGVLVRGTEAEQVIAVVTRLRRC
jgi:transposase-like protein